jgi:hypothetical protein
MFWLILKIPSGILSEKTFFSLGSEIGNLALGNIKFILSCEEKLIKRCLNDQIFSQ